MSQEKPSHAGSANIDPEKPEKPSIQDQEFTLLDIQTLQSHVFKKTGMADKVWRRRVHEPQLIIGAPEGLDLNEDTPTARLVAATLGNKRDREESSITVGVRVVTTEAEGDGEPRALDAGFVPVGWVYARKLTSEMVREGEPAPSGRFFNHEGTRVMPVDGFTQEDVDTVVRELLVVQQAQDEGLLPDLNTDMASISEPQASPLSN